MQMPTIDVPTNGEIRQKQYAVFPLDKFIQQQAPQVQEMRRRIDTTSMNDPSVLDAKMKEILEDRAHRYPDIDTKLKAFKAVLTFPRRQSSVARTVSVSH